MKLDSVTVVPFPDSAAWAAFYEKFFGPLVNSLNRAYDLADREDAVEEAFYKLMFKKDRDAYEKVPETESDWFYALRWQARAELSHLREPGTRRSCPFRLVKARCSSPSVKSWSILHFYYTILSTQAFSLMPRHPQTPQKGK